MGDRIIVTDDEPKPAPQVVVVEEKEKPKVETLVHEKTTIVEKKSSASS